ncbi:MAG TPA: EamA family transporter [Ktedonobacterales bacterium]|nr:EamA family transporter [Ktedonobacterales bacterium]
MLYVILGHRMARDGGRVGIDRLGAAMLVALLTITPLGLGEALPAFTNAQLLLAGIGVGLCSSVIPYVTDQMAMARLPRATFALLLSLLPATAALIGAVILRQIPAPIEILGIALIMCGVAIHQEASAPLQPAIQQDQQQEAWHGGEELQGWPEEREHYRQQEREGQHPGNERQCVRERPTGHSRPTATGEE